MTKIDKSSEINVGSTWNKWDLHIHSPYTNMNGYACSDEKFIQKIQDENLACVGLTNYFKFRDEEYDLKEKLEKFEIKVLMNLELRLDYQNNNQSGNENLDLHILFSETTTKTEIEKLLNSIECNIKGNSKRLIDLSSEEDFKFAVVNFDKLFECLKSESLNLQGKYLIGFLSRGKGNSRSSSNFEKIANKVHFLIHSTDNQDNIDKDIKFWQQYDKPVLQSSDAHNLETIGSKFSWIKAKPIFDGLKQVVYEIERVHIGKEPPPSPLYKLEKVQLDFDNNAMWNSEQKFCFSNFNQPLYFSPYFTCIIGGRGSGKSTLLNLIANKIDKLDGKNKEKLPIDSKEKTILEPNVVDNIEFLAQNKIEEFATNSVKFTQAIFERLDKKTDGKLDLLKKQIMTELEIFDKYINILIDIDKKTKELEKIQDESNKIDYLLKTFTDEVFVDSYTRMNIHIKNKNIMIKWQENYQTALQNLSQLIETNKLQLQDKDEPLNGYKKLQDYFNSDLEKIFKKYNEKFTEEANEVLKNTEEEINCYKQKMDDYLSKRGYNLENLNDVKNSISRQSIILDDIVKRKSEIVALSKIIDSFNIDNINNYINNFDELIIQQLDSINDNFKNIVKKYQNDIKTIEIKYAKNDSFEKICDEFITILNQYFQIEIREKVVFKSYLKELSLNDETLTFEQAGERVNNFNKVSDTNIMLKTIFNTKVLWNIYHCLVMKHSRNIEYIKNFNVYYDNKVIANSSFGQRCTAVIVILLALGNNPIIMDEPEAHLDSSLIANYLVELIKQEKKNRQIIFATHNANFVLNADAELIIKLNNDSGKITAQSFSIEDSQYREDLLKLEGGKEAFRKRKKKYEINNISTKGEHK